MKSNKRTIFLLILLLILGVVGYPIIMGNKKAPMPEAAQPILSDEENLMLTDITNATLDVSVLSSSELLGLSDFSLPLPGFPVGRANPFAPIR